LSDGAHISRNPEDTCRTLEALIDLRGTLHVAGHDMPETLLRAIERQAAAVRFFRHADGALCLFNGATEGAPALIDALLAQAGGRAAAPPSLPDAGYARLSRGRGTLIMDVGAPLASAYSSESHAGILSFEFSHVRDRLIVNCGAAAPNPRWRRVLRSTLAHSTVCADNRNAFPLEGEGVLVTPPSVVSRRHDDGAALLIEASHSGYAARLKLTHQRVLRLAASGDMLSGEDRLTGTYGIPAAARFHLHPAVTVLSCDEGAVILTAKSGARWRFTSTGGLLSVEESIYAGSWGGQSSSQIVMAGVSGDCFAWELKKE